MSVLAVSCGKEPTSSVLLRSGSGLLTVNMGQSFVGGSSNITKAPRFRKRSSIIESYTEGEIV